MSFIINPYAFGTEEWTPANLFLGGQEGVWIDPSDLTTMWQDSAMTVQADTNGDPVRVIEDKSGNGYHLEAPSDSQRPILTLSGGLWSLDFDGSNDYMDSPLFSSEFSQPNYVCVGFERTDTTILTHGIFDGVEADHINAFRVSFGGGERYQVLADTSYLWTSPDSPDLDPHIATIIFDDSSSEAYIDQASQGVNGNSLGTDTLTALRIGANQTGTRPLEGRIHGLVLRDTSFLGSQALLETWMAGKTGVTL